MISIDDVTAGLSQLGFESGWAYSDIGYPEGILIWEHEKPMPSVEDITKAAPLWADTLAKREQAEAAKREALLKRLGLTAEEFALLVNQ